MDAADARRLVQVLRLRPGDTFPALGKDGSVYTCVLENVPGGLYALRVSRPAPVPATALLPDVRSGKDAVPEGGAEFSDTFVVSAATNTPRIHLALGLLKGSKFDDVVRIATEAGVQSIIPLACEHSVVRADAGFRRERLERIVREALGQSGSTVPTSLAEAVSPAELAKIWQGSAVLKLVFHEKPLAELGLHQYCVNVCNDILACVGPEGGFSQRELDLLLAAGFNPGWLGPTILRAESAAIFALASIRIICLERSSWISSE